MLDTGIIFRWPWTMTSPPWHKENGALGVKKPLIDAWDKLSVQFAWLVIPDSQHQTLVPTSLCCLSYIHLHMVFNFKQPSYVWGEWFRIAGVEIANRGQIRFVKRGPNVTGITLSISYEVPDILVRLMRLFSTLKWANVSKDKETQGFP